MLYLMSQAANEANDKLKQLVAKGSEINGRMQQDEVALIFDSSKR
jgi:hypothetical protein